MDPKCSAQDLVRCHLCETPLPPLHCDTCHLDLCKACVGEHLLDDSRQHKMVPFKQRGTTPIYPNCPNHDKKQCEFYCKECIVPVCSSCILTNSHKGHTLLHSLDVIESKLKDVEKDVDELQNSIYPKYEEIVLELVKEKADLEIYYGKLTTNAKQMGEDLHKEINILVNKRKTEINEMKTKHLAVLNQQEDKIENTVSEITQSIANLKKLLVSKDVCLVSENYSKNAQFRKLPPKLKVSLPKFTSLEIKRDQLTEQFGSLSEISFTEEERGNIMPTQEVHPASPNRYEEEEEPKGEGWRRERGAPREDRPLILPPRDAWRSRGEDRVPSRDGGDRGGKEGWSRRDDRGPAKEDRVSARWGFSQNKEERGNIMPTQEVHPASPNRQEDKYFGKRDDRDFGRRDDRYFGRRDDKDRDFGRRDDRDFGNRRPPREDRDFGDRRASSLDLFWRSYLDREGFSDRAPPREETDWGGWEDRWGGGGGGEERRGGDAWRDRHKEEGGDKKGGGAFKGGRTGWDSWRERTGEKEGWSRRDDRGPAREDKVSARWGLNIISEVLPPSPERGRKCRNKKKKATRKPQGEEDDG